MSKDETEIEALIQAKGLTRPRLTPQDVDDTIKAETYTTLPSGKVMVCELTLRNGFTVRGDVERCHICGEPMTEGESLRQNCGGGCLICMAEAGDPDCIEAAFRLQKAEIARLLAVVDEVHAWAVCGCIATPDDMAKNLPRIVEITTPNARLSGRQRP
jgi:hypothetical protein